MITSEMLRETGSKHQCQLALDHATANGWLEEFNSHRRHPDTIVGAVLSVEEADKLWNIYNPNMLVHAIGMCIYSNDAQGVVFLTDDSQYGCKILMDRGWRAISFRHRGTAHKNFDSWAQHLSHFEKGRRVLQSEQELLDYLNQGA